MSSVEYEPKASTLEVDPEKRDAQTLSEFGVQRRPVSPKTITDDSGQVVAQSVGDGSDGAIETVEVPYTEDQARAVSKGDVSDAKTWFGAMLLRKIKKAFVQGLSVIVKSE